MFGPEFCCIRLDNVVMDLFVPFVFDSLRSSVNRVDIPTIRVFDLFAHDISRIMSNGIFSCVDVKKLVL